MIPVHVVDTFTGQPFTGNPAAVVILAEKAEDAWMQDVAAELRHSETAFLLPDPHDDTAPIELRWFTPTSEVRLCGHATLAAGHVLGGQRQFLTRTGILTTHAENGWVQMDFPLDTAQPLPDNVRHQVAACFPLIQPEDTARGMDDILVQLPTADDVRRYRPDMQRIAALPARGLIITAPSPDTTVDFVSRCFYPGVGVPEDPVTGSAHCLLAAWWAPRLGRTGQDMTAVQAAPRGGTILLRTADDNRVTLSGRAVTVISGTINTPPPGYRA